MKIDMITTSEDFLNQFYSIQNDTVRERRKHFHTILRSCNFSMDEQQKLFKTFKANNYLESVFYIDILIHFKETRILFTLLEHGDDMCIKKIIKQPWFLKEIFLKVSPESLVKDTLPILSYSLKCRVLKKLMLLLPEDQIDCIFDYLLDKYGLLLSSTVLVGCSVKKIDNVLRRYNITLRSQDLRKMFKKDRKLILIYAEEKQSRNIAKIFDRKLCTYLCEQDPVFFWHIFSRNKSFCDIIFGRHITKKLLVIGKDRLVNEPITYIDYFKEERLVRILNKQEFLELLKNLFPDEIAALRDYNVNSRFRSLLDHIPVKNRYSVFHQAFEKRYEEDVINGIKCFDGYFLKCIENRELRMKYAKKILADTNNIQYIKYYDFPECNSLIKERINFTSDIKMRSRLLSILVECCLLNRDFKNLEEVLQYFCERHRNENHLVRGQFLGQIQSNFEENRIEFNDTCWKYLLEIFTIQFMNNEYEFSGNNKLIMKYLENLYNKNQGKQAENLLIKFVPKFITNYGFFDTVEFIKNAEVEKNILLHIYNSREILLIDESDKKLFCQSLVENLFKYNKRFPNNKIEFDNDMQKFIVHTINAIEEADTGFSLLAEHLFKVNLDDFQKELLKIFWEKKFLNATNYSQMKVILKWSFKHNPSLLVQNLGEFISYYCKKIYYINFVEVWHQLKLYSHLQLDVTIQMVCSNILTHSEERTEKLNSVKILSYLLSTEEYIELMKDLSAKVETNSKFKLQGYFMTMMKNTNQPSKYVPLLFDKVYEGASSKCILPSLYKAFYKLPERSLESYLKRIQTEKSFSYQKCAAILGCRVFSKTTAIQTLRWFENSKNKSLNSAIFLSALNYFVKNPAEDVFLCCQMLMKICLSEDNIETLKKIVLVNVNNTYKERYLQSIWILLESFKSNSEINSIKIACLKAFEDVSLQYTSFNDVYLNIIKNYFLSEGSEDVNLFVIKCLISCNEDKYYSVVFEKLANYKSKFWNNYEFSNRKIISHLVCTFVKTARKNEVDKGIAEKFLKYWRNTFGPCEAFTEFLLLNFLIFWKENDNLQKFAFKIITYLHILDKQYQYVFSDFTESLSEFMESENEEVQSNLLQHLLKLSKSNVTIILVIELIKIQADFICENRIRKKYFEINERLVELLDNNFVQLHYNRLLEEFECNNYDEW